MLIFLVKEFVSKFFKKKHHTNSNQQQHFLEKEKIQNSSIKAHSRQVERLKERYSSKVHIIKYIMTALISVSIIVLTAIVIFTNFSTGDEAKDELLHFILTSGIGAIFFYWFGYSKVGKMKKFKNLFK